uniref:(northern house mosquito) hypothetical protein n=1 Tax=Culex pipiens TaxID=7175 RepID=A0A8D8BFH6_CULPI
MRGGRSCCLGNGCRGSREGRRRWWEGRDDRSGATGCGGTVAGSAQRCRRFSGFGGLLDAARHGEAAAAVVEGVFAQFPTVRGVQAWSPREDGRNLATGSANFEYFLRSARQRNTGVSVEERVAVLYFRRI